MIDLYDVIIIGCGPSGIGAGIEFEKMKSNIKYIILEARDRIGGRAYTDITTFDENTPVDIGAHYLCHHEENNYLRNHYISSDKDFIESDSYDKLTMKIFHENGNLISDDLINKAMKYVDDLLLRTREYSNEISDTSIYDLIRNQLENIYDNNMKSVIKMCLSYIECHEGSNLNELSSKCYGKGEGNLIESDLSIFNGLGTLVKNIASKSNLSIQFNSIVTNINILNNIVEIKTKDKKKYLCKYVLLTIPLGCLKSNSISFSPSLPQWKQDAIEKMGFGLLNKIYLQFSNRFWDKQLKRITIVKDQSQFYYCVPEYSMLALYVSGYQARQFEQKTDKQIIDDIFQSLRQIYPNITYPIKWLITRWGSDPFSQGSYSSFHVGSNIETLKELARETHDGHVCWAGEHTSFNGSIGYVDSGFESGIREAKRIFNKLQLSTEININ
ncbi:unnamed protein product [Adineta steineri]|uniref:Amine oxidase domain-containing protein n=1 Tax=Adineta steineri TaxID=433720 RepID=A0A814KQG9_9BILA|nr:unnamed protein product [Adineta steineri]